MQSTLTKKQVKTFGPKRLDDDTVITAKVRHDDECGNGHNTFAITATLYGKDRVPYEETIKFDGRTWWTHGGGCCHEEVAKAFPELAPLIKWHLTSTDGPMHYVANTVYHATEDGPKSAWVYFEDQANGVERHCVKYCDIPEAENTCKTAGYTMEVDPKTAKVANLDYARSSAVWPDATREQLLDKDALLARLPALMAEFKQAVESLGFTY